MGQGSITDVAKYQRFLILAILAQIAILVLRGLAVSGVIGASSDAETAVFAGVSLLLLLGQMAVAVLSLVMLILLMTAMDRPIVSRVLAAISQFIPLVGLIVLLVVNGNATKMLRGAGYHVGLMGASR